MIFCRPLIWLRSFAAEMYRADLTFHVLGLFKPQNNVFLSFLLEGIFGIFLILESLKGWGKSGSICFTYNLNNDISHCDIGEED